VGGPADSLPDDVDALRALALSAIAERDAAIAEGDRLMTMNEKLLLRKAQGFEAKSERLAKLDPDQLNLALEDIEQMIAKAAAIEERRAGAASILRSCSQPIAASSSAMATPLTRSCQRIASPLPSLEPSTARVVQDRRTRRCADRH
jgi:hypothetical protein